MKDSNLSMKQKSFRIQQLMDGRKYDEQPTLSSTIDDSGGGKASSSLVASSNHSDQGQNYQPLNSIGSNEQQLSFKPLRRLSSNALSSNASSGSVVSFAESIIAKQRRHSGTGSVRNQSPGQQSGQKEDDELVCIVINDDDKNKPQQIAPCTHYERNCYIVAPCCNQVFGCRICHDDIRCSNTSSAIGASGRKGAKMACLPLDRFSIGEIVCRKCSRRQNSKTNKCIECDTPFGEYHCQICNLWMTKSKSPFHCAKCGICRVGGRDNFVHCDLCCMCVSRSSHNNKSDNNNSSSTTTPQHKCIRDKYKTNCPVCQENLFFSRQSPQDLPCGHTIHSHCFRKLAGFDYRCPVCKKTIVPSASMSSAWNIRAREIALQPMPSELARSVSIICNDCEKKTGGLSWHVFGVQCPECDSFNTIVDDDDTYGGDDNISTTHTTTSITAASVASAATRPRTTTTLQEMGDLDNIM